MGWSISASWEGTVMVRTLAAGVRGVRLLGRRRPGEAAGAAEVRAGRRFLGSKRGQ